MDKEQITESTPTGGSTTSRSKNPAKKFLQAATVPILVFLVIFGVRPGDRLAPLCRPVRVHGAEHPHLQPVSYQHPLDYDSLQVGDIIVYNRPYDHIQVVHRIIAVLPDGIITKGDANPVDDGILLTEADIYGVYLGHIPGVGRLANIIRTPVGIAVILAAVVLLLLSDARPQKQSKDGNTPQTANRSRPKKRVRPCRYLTSRYLQGLYFFLCASSSVQ